MYICVVVPLIVAVTIKLLQRLYSLSVVYIGGRPRAVDFTDAVYPVVYSFRVLLCTVYTLDHLHSKHAQVIYTNSHNIPVIVCRQQRGGM